MGDNSRGNPHRARESGGVFLRDCEPRRETPTNHHTTTTNAPHAPLGLRIDFKGASLGLRLDLTASRSGPAWGKGGSTFTGRRAVLHSFSGGGRPSQPDGEKAFTPPSDRALKKLKRASRGRRPLTVITDNPLPSAKDGRPHPRAAVSRGLVPRKGNFRANSAVLQPDA